MKHLNTFRTFESMRNLKNKEELDRLSKEEIEQYQSDFLQSRLFDKQYHHELELYIELRFDKNKNFLQNLIQKEIDGGLSTNLSRRSEELILSIIKKDGGLEFMNNGMIDDLKKKVGEPKFII